MTTQEARLMTAQAAEEVRLNEAQKASKSDLDKIFDSNNFKLVFMLSGAIFTFLAIYDYVGIYIHNPWRKYTNASNP